MLGLYIVLTVIAVLLITTVIMLYPGSGCAKMRKVFKNASFAHRGLHTKDMSVPENSMTAFRLAAEAGYGIELDIQLAASGEVVIFHDMTTDRVCGVSNTIEKMSFDEISELRLCGSDERVPLFKDFLEMVDGRVPLLIELKPTSNYNNLCRAAWEFMKDYKGNFCIESFDPRIVCWFRKNHPEILRGQLTGPCNTLGRGDVTFIIRFMISSLLSNVIARPHFISYKKYCFGITHRLTRFLGAMTFVWTVRDDDDADELARTNDAIIFEFIKVQENPRP